MAAGPADAWPSAVAVGALGWGGACSQLAGEIQDLISGDDVAERGSDDQMPGGGVMANAVDVDTGFIRKAISKGVGEEEALLEGRCVEDPNSVFEGIVGPDLLSTIDDAVLRLELRNAVHVNAPLGVNLTEARHVLVAEEVHVALLMRQGRSEGR
jgi:hypothetical protein